MTMNFHEEYAVLLRHLLHRGRPVSPRGKPTAELEDVVVNLGAGSDDAMVAGRTSLRYLLAETAWYCSRNPRVDFIRQYASLWGRVVNPDGTANSNYGEKIWGATGWTMTEWTWARSRLVADHSTRQAVMVVHRPSHHWEGNKDVPCTLTISFAIREGRLKMRAHMRSSDAWYGLPYDVPFFRWLQRRMLADLHMPEVKLGSLRVMLDSLHLYEDKRAAALKLLNEWRPAASWVNPVPVDLSLDETAALCEDLLSAVLA